MSFLSAQTGKTLSVNRTGVMTALSLSEKYQLLDSSDPNQVAAFLFFVPGLDKQHVGCEARFQSLGASPQDLPLYDFCHCLVDRKIFGRP